MNLRLDTLCRTLGTGALVLALGAAVLAPTGADARGFVRFGVGIGLPFFGPYYAPYYPPPPVYYAQPPVYYVPPPPPVYYAPPAPAVYTVAPAASAAPPTAAQTASNGQQCREYQTTTVIEGTPQETVGTACRQPDGTWRIVN